MTNRNDNSPQGYCGFEVGQHVVYLGGGPRNEYDRKMRLSWVRDGLTLPTPGRVYTIRSVYVGATNDPACPSPVCILLNEIRNPMVLAIDGLTREVGFRVDRFRPLPKLRVEDFLAASAPKDVVGRVPA